MEPIVKEKEKGTGRGGGRWMWFGVRGDVSFDFPSAQTRELAYRISRPQGGISIKYSRKGANDLVLIESSSNSLKSCSGTTEDADEGGLRNRPCTVRRPGEPSRSMVLNVNLHPAQPGTSDASRHSLSKPGTVHLVCFRLNHPTTT